MALFYQPELSLNHLSPEESRHAIRVLRLTRGDEIELTDGKGHLCRASISKADDKETEFTLLETTVVSKRNFFIHLAIAPTKNIDRVEWMVEKCTEIGVDRISFIQCKTAERTTIPMDRLQKITISAMKQSHQAWLPEVSGPLSLVKVVQASAEGQRFIAHVDELNTVHLSSLVKPAGNYTVLIGPEGDFTKEELGLAIQHGFQKVSLGQNRLRTETAGLYAVTTLNILNTSGFQDCPS